MKKPIITIGRQFGAGGRELGKELAKRLDIPYFDKELIHKAAELSGLSEEYLENKDERATTSFLYSLVMGTRTLTGQPSLEEMTWKAEQDAILSAAKEGGCVIVGRCADYILRDRKELFRVFIMADEARRMEHVSKRDGISLDEAASKMKKMDKRRAAYYNMYAEHSWGTAGNYDLCINMSKVGTEKAIEMVLMSL